MTEQEYKDAIATVIEHLYTKEEVISMFEEIKDYIEFLRTSPAVISDDKAQAIFVDCLTPIYAQLKDLECQNILRGNE